MASPPQPTAPLVSIVIAYFNGQQYIREAVESARNQTHPAIELIVVDDGSTELAHEALRAIPGPIVVRQPNGGVAAARNRGLQAATGEYLIYLDQDDRLLPDAVRSHLQAIEGRDRPGLVFGAIRQIDSKGEITGAPYVCAPRRDYFLSMLESNPIHCPAAAMIRRGAMLEVGGMDPEVAPAEDFDLYMRLAKVYPVVRHTALVAEYRIHTSNVSQDRGKMVRATHRVMDKVERTMTLTPGQRRRVRHGRRRAVVFFNDHPSKWQRLEILYFRLRSFLQSSFREMIREH